MLILGVAYKKNIGDLRESPALDIIRLLQEKGAEGLLSTTRTCPMIKDDGHTPIQRPADARAFRSPTSCSGRWTWR